MKNKNYFIMILVLLSAFLFCSTDPVSVMASEQTEETAALDEPEQIEESGAATAPEELEEPGEAAESGQAVEPDAAVESEETGEPGEAAESGQTVEPDAAVEAEETAESVAVTGLEQKNEPVPDSVSTGQSLIEWLESHKNCGGTVKLEDHLVLEGDYSFCPNGIKAPEIFVDTGPYTITVAGEIELMSDGRLIFKGQPDGRGIFYIAEKGVLSMTGIVVESSQCALWQEEGGGLVLDSSQICQISGSIHYADTPFVMYQRSGCILVEKGQTVNDVLPLQIKCTVNRQGRLYHDEPIALSWNLEGTEKQQKKRRRFKLQGSFLGAASMEPALWTVVYNDYPLTFTDVNASVRGSLYTFHGGYTVPEEELPITVMSEHSFNGKDWIMYEKTEVKNTDPGFYIAFKLEPSDMEVHSRIYIRLQGMSDGTRYFSNVLCYTADDLDDMEDIGGSRGGGTSIVNPPDQPEENKSDADSAEDTVQNENGSTDSGNIGSEPVSDPKSAAGESNDTIPDGGPLSDTAVPVQDKEPESDTEQPFSTQYSDAGIEQPSYAEAKTDCQEVIHRNESDVSENIEETVAALSIYGEDNAGFDQGNAEVLHPDSHRNRNIVIAAGFVLLSSIAGIIGFYVHSRLATNR